MAFGGRRQFGGPREMHKAVCAECGQECEVPFKPAEGRPVYCRDCYAKKRGPTNRFERGPRQEQQPQKEAPAESEDFEESSSEETEEFSEE